MTQAVLNTLEANLAAHAFAQQAWAYWQGYGALNRVEAWRWTPLAVLRGKDWRFEATDYQFSLPEAVAEDFLFAPKWAQALLAVKDLPFAALNIALLEDALVIRVPEGCVCEELVGINIDQLQRSLQFSRVQLEVGAGAKVGFWLDFHCGANGGQLPVVQLEVGAGACVDGVFWLAGGAQSLQLASIYSQQEANSALRLSAVAEGGALSRVDVVADLLGDAAQFAFGGVQCLQGNEVGDFHVRVNHRALACESVQAVRGVLDEEALGIFDGLIYVAEGAQQTDAKQDSRYILLSEQAKSHSVPRLEIYADDVQCAHGSTVGYVDPDALFYLQSRGITEAEARRILILSFLHEAVVVTHEELEAQLHEAISDFWLEHEG